jgi:PRTRC genetic system protein A
MSELWWPGIAIPGLIGRRFATDAAAQRAPVQGREREILVGRNGVFLQADRPVGRLTVPHTMAAGPLHGLWPVAPGVRLRHGPIPLALLAATIALFREAAAGEPPLEMVALIVIDGAGCYRLHVPEQERHPDRVSYSRPAEWPVALALHSHHVMDAYFSATDDADETAPGLYGVVGELDLPNPTLRLRAGIEGAFWPLSAADLFADASAAAGALFREPATGGPGSAVRSPVVRLSDRDGRVPMTGAVGGGANRSGWPDGGESTEPEWPGAEEG